MTNFDRGDSFSLGRGRIEVYSEEFSSLFQHLHKLLSLIIHDCYLLCIHSLTLFIVSSNTNLNGREGENMALQEYRKIV